MTQQTQRKTSSKAYIRNFNNTKHYRLHRVLPDILNVNKNGGNRSSMTLDEWVKFCDKIDGGFQRINLVQSIVWAFEVTGIVFAVLYLILMMFTNLMRYGSFKILIGLIGVGFVLLIIDCCVQRFGSKRGIERAKVFCKKRNLEAQDACGRRFGHRYYIPLE